MQDRELNRVYLYLTITAPVVAVVLWMAADHFAVAEHTKRLEAIEANQKWQNELLYRIDENVKHLENRGGS